MDSRETAFELYYERAKHLFTFRDPKEALRQAFDAGAAWQVDSIYEEALNVGRNEVVSMAPISSEEAIPWSVGGEEY